MVGSDDFFDQLITKNLREDKVLRSNPISQAFREVSGARDPNDIRDLKGGNPHSGPHGFFDGLYWRNLYDQEQLGFLQGYLWCLEENADETRATFTKSPNDYVSLINQWYELDEDTGEVNADKEVEKIPTVLYAVRKQHFDDPPDP